MMPRDWLLLLLDGGLDPIRVQKGMFLFAMNGGVPAAERYTFEPYNWGPLSKRIYVDLEELLATGLVERVPVPGASYTRYRRTQAGNVAAEGLATATPEPAKVLAAIGSKVRELGFNELLQYVYAQYPDYATKSLFKTATAT